MCNLHILISYKILRSTFFSPKHFINKQPAKKLIHTNNAKVVEMSIKVMHEYKITRKLSQ